VEEAVKSESRGWTNTEMSWTSLRPRSGRIERLVLEIAFSFSAVDVYIYVMSVYFIASALTSVVHFFQQMLHFVPVLQDMKARFH